MSETNSATKRKAPDTLPTSDVCAKRRPATVTARGDVGFTDKRVAKPVCSMFARSPGGLKTVALVCRGWQKQASAMQGYGTALPPITTQLQLSRGTKELNKTQLQLRVTCHTTSEVQSDATVRYDADKLPTRVIVIGSGMSLHDLTRTIMCSFGLSDIFSFGWSEAGGRLEVKACWFNDFLKFDNDGIVEWKEHRGVHGLPVKTKKRGILPEVSMSTLKATRVAQVLDKPLFSTATRSKDEGARTMLGMGLRTDARMAFVSQWSGGMLSAAKPCYYSFSIQLTAVGTREDMISHCQSTLPRCVYGKGKVYGGNTIDFDYGTEQDTEQSRAQIDELNCNFVGKKIARGGVLCGSALDGHGIRGWQRVPLFEVCDGDDGEVVAESYGRGRTEGRSWQLAADRR